MSSTAKRFPEEDLEHELKITEEASLLWDEYKYRHDLIWRHMIRSTVALVVLLTLRYTTEFGDNYYLSVGGWFLAVMYTGFTVLVVHNELELYDQIKKLHRKRQHYYFGLFPEIHDKKRKRTGSGFSSRVMFYLIVLFILVCLAGPISLCSNQVKISFVC
jgi:hypothetical protein